MKIGRLGYARVSTDKKAQDESVDAQIRALKQAGCQTVLTERASAFKRGGKRKQWEICKELIASGEVSHFMICSLARGSRQGENSEMSRLCKANKVEFVILDGTNSDVSTPEGLLMVKIFDAVNEADSLIKGIAVKRGRNARRAKGATAAGRCPFGYVYDGCKPVPGPTWKQAKELWQLLRDNEYIARKVLQQRPDLPFTDPGLRKWIANPLLMGRPRYSAVEVEPLVEPAEWHRAQELIANRCKFNTRAPKQIHLFTQMVECQGCGKYMTTVWGGKDPKHRLKCMNVGRCDFYGRGLAEWKVRDQVIETLKEAAPQMVKEVEKATQTTDNTLSPEQIAVRRRLETLTALQKTGAAELDKAISAARLELDALSVRTGANWAELGPLIRQDAFLEGMKDRQLRPIVAELVEQILYVGDPMKVKITLCNPF